MTVSRNVDGIETRLVFNTIHKVGPYLRLSYCSVVNIELRALTVEDKQDLRGVILDDLVIEHASVGRMNMVDDSASARVFMRKSSCRCEKKDHSCYQEPPRTKTLRYLGFQVRIVTVNPLIKAPF